VRNFVKLCMEGYYDNCGFHRVIDNYIAQTGDPSGSGSGGASIYGQAFADEINTRLKFTRRGIVGMASEEQDANESQFFFTLAATPTLNKRHTVFGRIVGNTIYNLEKFKNLEIGENDRPVHPPRILKTTVLVNPFPDIVPRVNEIVGQEEEEEAKKKKKKKKRKKDLNLLSFGDEEEQALMPKKKRVKRAEEEEEPVAAPESSSPAATSSSSSSPSSTQMDIVKDDDDSSPSRDKAKKKKKKSKKDKSSSSSTAANTLAMQAEFDSLVSDIRGISDAKNGGSVALEAEKQPKEQLTAVQLKRKAYLEKNANKKSKQTREADTLQRLQAFTSLMTAVPSAAKAEPEKKMKLLPEGVLVEEDAYEGVAVTGNSWIGHEVNFGNRAQDFALREQASKQADYEIMDTKNGGGDVRDNRKGDHHHRDNRDRDDRRRDDRRRDDRGRRDRERR
jgi:peptidyl-prolyl cis-trans isomerase SDCCAG10